MTPPEVEILWEASGLMNTEFDYSRELSFVDGDMVVDGNVYSHRQQLLRPGMIPTAAAVVDQGSVILGGLDDAGNTVVDLWPMNFGAIQPQLQVDPTTGLTHAQIVLPTKGQVTRILTVNTERRRGIRNICAVRREGAPSTSVLIQFHDSGDVCQLVLASGALTLVVSDDSGPHGAAPSLGKLVHRQLSFGHRLSHGYVYTLVADAFDGDSASFGGFTFTTPSVLLIDADKNGSIDSVSELLDAEYVQQGWRDSANYHEPWTY